MATGCTDFTIWQQDVYDVTSSSEEGRETIETMKIKYFQKEVVPQSFFLVVAMILSSVTVDSMVNSMVNSIPHQQ